MCTLLSASRSILPQLQRLCSCKHEVNMHILPLPTSLSMLLPRALLRSQPHHAGIFQAAMVQTRRQSGWLQRIVVRSSGDIWVQLLSSIFTCTHQLLTRQLGLVPPASLGGHRCFNCAAKANQVHTTQQQQQHDSQGPVQALFEGIHNIRDLAEAHPGIAQGM